ncbi:MAG: hypothetical protein ABL940_03200 [Bacteroidia bacterium]
MLLSASVTFAQKTLKDFDGEIIFKTTNYVEPINRLICDTLISYQSFSIVADSIRSQIKITDHYLFRNHFEEYEYLKFNFIKKEDSLLICYYNPILNKKVSSYIYPLNKRDTLYDCGSYKLGIDSSFNKTKGVYDKDIDICNNNETFNITYKKDTLIKFNNYTFDCYEIELNRGFIRSYSKRMRKIFIDKGSLIPVYEIEYLYFKRGRCNTQVNKWLLSKETKIIEIDN